MVKLNVLELLEKQGRTKYWLYKQLGMSYQNFNRMVNNETQSIKLERIETLCLLLNCTPNDLFVIDCECEHTPQQEGHYRCLGCPCCLLLAGAALCCRFSCSRYPFSCARTEGRL